MRKNAYGAVFCMKKQKNQKYDKKISILELYLVVL